MQWRTLQLCRTKSKHYGEGGFAACVLVRAVGIVVDGGVGVSEEASLSGSVADASGWLVAAGFAGSGGSPKFAKLSPATSSELIFCVVRLICAEASAHDFAGAAAVESSILRAASVPIF